MLTLNEVLNNGREERTEEINGRFYVGVSPRSVVEELIAKHGGIK